MKRVLRVPAAIAFTLVAGTTGAAITALPACGHGESPTDGQLADGIPVPDDGSCSLFCIPDGTDAGVCPNPAPCADEMGNCPAGCTPVG